MGRFRGRVASFLVLVAMLASSVSRAGVGQLIPADLLEGYPAWVPVEQLVDADGDVRWNLLEPNQALSLRRHLAALSIAPEGTDPLLECSFELGEVMSVPVSVRPTATLDDLVEHSPAVLLGQVTDMAPGLLNGVLGTLMAVEVETSYRTSVAGPPNEVQVFLQVAEVTLQGIKLCKPGQRPLPEIGSRLLLFHLHEVSPELPGSIVSPTDDEVFFELSGALSSLPIGMSSTLGSEYTISFDELVERVEDRLREGADR